MRIHRVFVAAGLLLLTACSDQPTAPEAGPQFGRGNPQPPPPIIPSDWTYHDLDAETAAGVSNVGYGVSDLGVVFVASSGSSTGLAYLTSESPMSIVTLPGTVGQRAGNGIGDYLTSPDRLMLTSGAGGWALGPNLPLPARWGTPRARGVNDARVVVGWGRDSARYSITKQGATYIYQSPLVWLDGASAATRVIPLNLPQPTTGCKLANVVATAVNNRGRIVGYADQVAAVSKAVCVRRAIYWDPRYDDPTNLPGNLLPSPDPMKDPYAMGKGASNALHYDAIGINDAGDVAGGLFVDVSASYRAVRWMHGSYERPEVLTGWIVTGLAIDECGRMLVGGVSYGALPGIWPLGWDGKLTLPLPDGFSQGVGGDFRNGRVVGSAFPTGTSGQHHAFLWTLDACPGHWPPQ